MIPCITKEHVNCCLSQFLRLTQVRPRTTTLGNADSENKDTVHHRDVSAMDTAAVERFNCFASSFAVIHINSSQFSKLSCTFCFIHISHC